MRQSVPPPAAVPQAVPPISKAVEPTAAPADESLDDYFDRLDVAFATRAQTPPRPFPHLAPPTYEKPDPSDDALDDRPVPVASERAIETAERKVIADLFKMFLEVEQGERDAASIRIPEEFDRIRRGNRIE